MIAYIMCELAYFSVGGYLQYTEGYLLTCGRWLTQIWKVAYLSGWICTELSTISVDNIHVALSVIDSPEV